MIIDGKKIAQEIKEALMMQAQESRSKTLAVVMVGSDPVSLRYVAKKKRLGEAIGVDVVVHEVSEDASESDLAELLDELGEDKNVDGLILQMPLPKHFDTDAVLGHIPRDKDIDALTQNSHFLSPIVLVVQELFERYGVDVKEKKVVVVGQGRLVGRPVTQWLESQDVFVATADIHTENLSELTQDADVVITGVGKSGLITPDMVKEGVVLIDAGTSEDKGKLVGDIDPACSEKASLITPVPGGVGPMTVVMLFKNLLYTKKQKGLTSVNL